MSLDEQFVNEQQLRKSIFRLFANMSDYYMKCGCEVIRWVDKDKKSFLFDPVILEETGLEFLFRSIEETDREDGKKEVS